MAYGKKGKYGGPGSGRSSLGGKLTRSRKGGPGGKGRISY